MRQWLAALLVLTAPAMAAAQPASVDVPSGLPLPSIGLPLPALGLPHPATGLPVPAHFAERRAPAVVVDGRGEHRGGGWVPPVFLAPVLVMVPVTASPTPASAISSPMPPAPLDGRLVIDTQPDEAQIYVDGYYVGTAADHPDGLALTAGPHALDVRAPGYDSQATSLRVPAGRSISYRAALRAAPAAQDSAASRTLMSTAAPASPAASAPPAPPAPAPSTFYIIRGCYMGNVAPSDAALPPGCDPAKAVAVRP